MRNRVTPWGDIVAIEQRGAWLGNRGILHEGTDVVRFHRSDLWITCRLQYRDWRLRQWEPGHFTVLYFFDEAVALAAGHRPCALCRREDYTAYRSAWVAGHADGCVTAALAQSVPPLAKEMDRQLHQERIVRGSHRRRVHPMPWPALPDATFVALDDEPHLVQADRLHRWSPQGYAAPRSRPRTGTAEVITPPATVAALRGGYRPQVDAGARAD
ncbi:hypothetical protein [Jatrophihabitans sp.]|uniref:hypothetical protein n=1 Tax=Jatrophihabitans sp. TaxID=1932789 RepID=UPI002B68F1B1|nr:hypothetical protein [Jatrophihabitans sp.]